MEIKKKNVLTKGTQFRKLNCEIFKLESGKESTIKKGTKHLLRDNSFAD